MTFKEDYQKQASAHNLPSFDTMQTEFEIDSDEPVAFALRHARRRICDHLSDYAKILEDIMQPEQSISSLVELKHMDEAGKERIYLIYKRIMALLRESIVVALATDDKQEARFVRDAYKEWVALKPQLSQTASILKDAWVNDKNIIEQLSYFG